MRNSDLRVKFAAGIATENTMVQKSKHAFKTISETADDLDVPQHVLRFWESKFSQIKPMKRGGNRRYYRRGDIELLKAIQHTLYHQKQTIKETQQALKAGGIKGFIASWKDAAGIVDAPEQPKPEPAPRPPEAETPVAEPVPEDVHEEIPEAADLMFEAGESAAPAEDDDTITISKDLLRALVTDLKALRALIDRM